MVFVFLEIYINTFITAITSCITIRTNVVADYLRMYPICITVTPKIEAGRRCQDRPRKSTLAVASILDNLGIVVVEPGAGRWIIGDNHVVVHKVSTARWGSGKTTATGKL